jgi:hypothetical protein
MKSYKRTLILATALCFSAAAMAQAGKLTVINKIPDQRVQLFIRGEGASGHYVELIEPEQQRAFVIEKGRVHNKPTFEVIASTGNGGEPDWKLLGGRCGELVTDSDHTIVINSTLGKTSCTNVTDKNPGAAG